MRIIIACGEFKGEVFSSGQSLITAFKKLGHEVITCGPRMGNYELPLDGEKDIKVLDKRIHPETYTYAEILEKAPKKPDLILQLDPHFYFVGEKPKDIKTAYYLVDVHRGGNVFRKMVIEGHFDFLFLAHKYFERHFLRLGLKPIWLPRAFDDTFICDYPEIEQECDISFCGQTGIADELLKFPCFDEKIGRKYHEGPFPDVPPEKRYHNWNTSMEYVDRAELLIRLSKDYKMRIYEFTYGPAYAKTICRGKIGFNRSLWKDSALRNFEVMACNKFLITDELPHQDELFQDKVHCRTYRSYYQPQFANFDLDYEEVKELIDYYLEHDTERKEIARRGNGHTFKNHTFCHRAEKIIKEVTK